MTVSFNRSAAQELIAAALKLAEVANFGGAFLDEYEAWETQIRKHPLSSPEIASGIRRGYLPRFKYHVTYTIRAQSIRILYVRYARQAPLTSFRRTGLHSGARCFVSGSYAQPRWCRPDSRVVANFEVPGITKFSTISPQFPYKAHLK